MTIKPRWPFQSYIIFFQRNCHLKLSIRAMSLHPLCKPRGGEMFFSRSIHALRQSFNVFHFVRSTLAPPCPDLNADITLVFPLVGLD